MSTTTATTTAALTTFDMGIAPNGVHHVLVSVGGEQVARITKRTASNPTPGFFAWIEGGERRGTVRDFQGRVVYFDTVDQALQVLAWII